MSNLEKKNNRLFRRKIQWCHDITPGPYISFLFKTGISLAKAVAVP